MFLSARTVFLVSAAFPLFACASTPGARPHDMSTGAHETAAAKEESTANAHDAQYTPDATETKEQCSASKRACWTLTANPTDGHKQDTEEHRKMAADHRGAAQALRDAEARSCVGIDDADRDMSPFSHREDISGVKEHVETTQLRREMVSKTTGADIAFRAVPGMTAEWLQRVVDCHVARASSVGHVMPEMSYCPLVLKNVSAKVTSTGSGFTVAVTSQDPATIKAIIQKSDGLIAKN